MSNTESRVYRTVIQTVTAMQWDGSDPETGGAAALVGWAEALGAGGFVYDPDGPVLGMTWGSLDGGDWLNPGDWLINTGPELFLRLDAETFVQQYEEIEGDQGPGWSDRKHASTEPESKTWEWDGSAEMASEIMEWALVHDFALTFWCADRQACHEGRHLLKAYIDGGQDVKIPPGILTLYAPGGRWRLEWYPAADGHPTSGTEMAWIKVI